MKKLGKLSAAAFSFASIANNAFAVEAGGSATSGIGDIIPFALGALLIICVLFLGYKMDKSAENAPTYKKEKAPKGKRAKSQKVIEAEEREAYAEENKADIPYEADENEYYENDNNFDYKSGLNDETEYEEDDISLFSAENNQESSFNDIDDNISYESYEEPKEEIYEEPTYVEPLVEEQANEEPVVEEPSYVEPVQKEDSSSDDFASTMLFDSSKLNELDDIEDYEDPKASVESTPINNSFDYGIGVVPPAEESVVEEPSFEETVEEVEEPEEYTDAVELDDKINSLDDLDDLSSIEVPELAKPDDQDAESFMNELNKFKEEAEEEDEDFGGFTTKSTPKETSYEEEKVEETPAPVQEKHVKRYTKKKTSSSVKEELPELPQVPVDNGYVEEPEEDQFIEEPSGQMDIGFLNQMEQNLKRNQEERMKKAGVDVPEEPKKRGRKSKKQ